MSHNEKIRQEVELLEHKRRKRDVLADEQAQFEFFDARIPAQVNDARSFEKWLARLGEDGRQHLYLGHDVLMRDDVIPTQANYFPDVLEMAGNRLQLSYHFEPGSPADGVTLCVPLELLNTLDEGQLQWLVPGLLRDKLIALIRGLAKPVRRVLTPVPVFADALLESLASRKNQPLLKACAEELSRMTGMNIDSLQLDEAVLPEHLRFRILVLDEKDREVAQGRDLRTLQNQLGVEAQRSFMDRQGAGFNRDGATHWDFGNLGECIETGHGQMAWPALVDQHTAVGLRLFDTPAEAVQSHTDGVLRLLALVLSDKLSYLNRHPDISRQSLLAWSSLGSADGLIADLVWSSLSLAAGDVSAIRDEQTFKALCEHVRSHVGLECQRQSGWLDELLPAWRRIITALNEQLDSRYPDAAQDMRLQLDDLVYEGFLCHLSTGRLGHYPRYLLAMEERLQALQENPLRDRQRMSQVSPWWSRYLEKLEEGAVYDVTMDEFRWLIEEYRVSLFAQRLGTAVKVSEKRLAAAWQYVLA